jgi:hypothetical protein
MEFLKWMTASFWHFIAILILLDVIVSNSCKIVIKLIDVSIEKKYYCHGCKVKEGKKF